MTALDPRVQLAGLAAVVIGALFGGVPGVAVAAAAALVTVRPLGPGRVVRRTVVYVAPLAAVILVADALAGQLDRGALTAARVLALALVGSAFAAVADGEALVAALRWLRVPYDMTFALVAGARLVPVAAADLADLSDAARLRGISIDGGPVDRLRSWSRLLVPLLVVTIRRGLRLGEAMEARGFVPGAGRTVRSRLVWRTSDTVATVAAVAYAIGVIAIGR
ncbi:MAG TPA: energy-coupling factor transporter transmembrane component T [Candidatus Limnocylindria bacterium]